jgi:cytochrome c5
MRIYSRKIVILAIALLLSACSASESRDRNSGMSLAAFSNDIADETVMGKWARSCALCHITGEAGAPVVGDTANWQRRLAQGEESILRNVIDGVNSMPPLGYCMSCEEADFRAMIAYMAGTVR